MLVCVKDLRFCWRLFAPFPFPQVSDFGQSRILRGTASVHDVGTRLWTAPEVLTEECHSQKSDSWSLGCTAVELFSEADPYHHKHNGDRREIQKVLRKVEKRRLVRTFD